MELYYENAKELVEFDNSCHDISTLPVVPVSNMFHVHFPHAKDQVESVLIKVY